MARVPYIPIPEAEPSGPVGRGTPYQNVNVSPNAFGAGAAAATQHMGGQLEQVGSEFAASALRAQQYQNNIGVDQALNNYQDMVQKHEFGDPNDPGKPGYYALKGSDAVSQYQPTAKAITDSRQQIEDSLPNNYMKKAFGTASRRLTQFTLSNIGRHYDQQLDTYNIATQTASINLALQGMGASWNSDEAFGHQLADAQRAQTLRDQAAGAAPEVAQWNQANLLSKALTARIEGALPYDAGAANKLLQDSQGKIPAAEFARLSTAIQTKANTLAATHGANEFITNMDNLRDNLPQPQAGDAVDRIIAAEGNGRNPNSSAQGVGQFIDRTWLDQIKRNAPDVAQGKSDDELLAMRGDHELGKRMVQSYAAENATALSEKGLPVNPGNLYLAHFAGPAGAAKVIGADPNTPVKDLLSADAIKANPNIANMNAGQMQQWAAQRMGDATAAQPTYQTRADFYEQHAADINDHLDAYAQAKAPNDPLAQDRIKRLVEGHIRTTIQAQNQQIAADKNLVEKWLNGSLTNGQKPTDLSQMPQGAVSEAYGRVGNFDAKAIPGFDNRLKANSKTDTSYGPGFSRLLSQVYSHQITDPTSLNQFVGDESGNGITASGQEALAKEMHGAATPQGSGEALMKMRFFEAAHDEISGQNAITADPEGEKNFEKFLSAALPAYDSARAKNETPDAILNPKNNHYLGNLIQHFAPKQADALKRMALQASVYAKAYADLNAGTPQEQAQKTGMFLKSEMAAGRITRAQATTILLGRFPDLLAQPNQQVQQQPAIAGGG